MNPTGEQKTSSTKKSKKKSKKPAAAATTPTTVNNKGNDDPISHPEVMKQKVTVESETGNLTEDTPLFPHEPGKQPNYGTNDTLELLERIPSQIVEMKLDDVLTAVKTVDNLCDFPRCKTKTSLMGQDCEHCMKRFCFKHGLPEVHGCGELAKKEERKNFLHPKTAKTIREERELEQAKKKLHAKLKDMQVGRMQKTGEFPISLPGNRQRRTDASAGAGADTSGGNKKKK